ncbi:o-succinylbenzoate synthase [Saccharicrinis sp. FJH54]|uniref:o-succinylbenzoate synthase n=1 Tax=Saccharicrinis sp. FJH54 TaxID=3344665 RepID=UPI0035D493FB
MNVRLHKYELIFRFPAGTSRGVLKTKPAWLLLFSDENKTGIGEISRLPGLSYDDHPEFETKLLALITDFNRTGYQPNLTQQLAAWPSIQFAFETGMADLHATSHIYTDNRFTRGLDGIPINGLIWMGERDWMLQQIDDKLNAGFRCLKMKIGAIGIETELDILTSIRKRYSAGSLELRVDANGAFNKNTVMPVLDRLAGLSIHSIEQPVKAGQPELMQKICQNTPVPVALDEELIGVTDPSEKNELLSYVSPQYIILKPGLLGGFRACEDWMKRADCQNIKYWITSSLESNIGLNAIAQWTSTLGITMHQGLGTGSLYENNFNSPLHIQEDKLWFDPARKFSIKI